MGIIVGLGSGRCGTTSLASLINSQPASACFHEAHPSAMAWSGTESSVLSILSDFRCALDGGPRAMAVERTANEQEKPALDKYLGSEELRHVGDIAYYYLPYVEYILSVDSEVRFPCLRRDREETVSSYVRWLRVPRDKSRRHRLARWITQPPEHRNMWAPWGDSRWKQDWKWSKSYPTFPDVSSVEDGARRYWDLYYREAENLQIRYPDNLRIFDMESLNREEGQEEILRFCSIDGELSFGDHRMNPSHRHV